MRTYINFILTAFIVAGSSTAAHSQVTSNPPYTIEQSVISSGGGISSGGAGFIYKIEGTIGEPIAGTTSSNSPFSIKGGFFTAQALAPTAAAVSISGRVITPWELGLTNAFVTLTDMQGNSKTVLTGKFGSFRFTNVTAGETYILNVSSKRYTYVPQVITVTEDLTELIFTAQ